MLSPQTDLYHNIAPHLANQHVLEIGFGTGFGTLQLAACAKEITAMEIEADAVTFAKQSLPLRNVAWVTSDINELYTQPMFDAAVMIEVLEHITDWQTALSNTASMLKEGGKLYISARNRNADLRRNDLHEREWSAMEFKLALETYFHSVTLYDYTLQEPQDLTTHITPLIAVATK